MDANALQEIPLSSEEVYVNTMIESGVVSAQKAVERGLSKDKIIISVKLSHLQSMLDAYQKIASQCEYPLHLGLTEAGGAMKGIVSSSMALGILLQQGIGDTIRVSLTPEIGTPRSKEVEVCKNILQSLGLKSFSPQVVSCPGCGRTSSNKFQYLAKYIETQIATELPRWKQKYENFEDVHIAVMGCIVNGIGEARNADIGIFIP
jgi:(E)-4-hydroxy-3-methylbut-2-enyl-diphosphate synthase